MNITIEDKNPAIAEKTNIFAVSGFFFPSLSLSC